MKQKRQCRECNEFFICYGECKESERIKDPDYCTCPKCVKSRYDAYLKCESRYGKDANYRICNEDNKEKVEFT